MADPPTGLAYDLALLPPELQVKLWALGLHADTDAVAIKYKPGQIVTQLKYNYGGALEASVALPQQSLTLSLDPKLSGQLVYKGFDFTGTLKGTPTSFGASLTFGAAPLPAPAMLEPVFNNAWSAIGRTWGDVAMAPSNPMEFLRIHKNDMKVIGEAAKAVQKVNGVDPTKATFGAGITFDYRSNADTSGAPKGASVLIFVGGMF